MSYVQRTLHHVPKHNLILRANQFIDVRFKKCGDFFTIFSKSSTLFFNKNKSLGFGIKIRISSEQSKACCPAEHKNKVSRLAISKIMIEHQNRAYVSLRVYCI